MDPNASDPGASLAALTAIVGAPNVLSAPDDVAAYLTDWRKRYTGRALAVVKPATTPEVAAVVAWCAETGTPIVPQGGNTGLVGGATPDDSGHAIVVCTARMNRIRAIDALNNTITVEAGCVLANVQQSARDAGRLFPLSLAAEGSCTIGGNLSTNAGGTAVLRYGNARELCLAIEAVMPDGSVVGLRRSRSTTNVPVNQDGGEPGGAPGSELSGLRKDNTGYDLRDLLIGAEGTLGVITAAVMRLYPLPRSSTTALAAVRSVRAALGFLSAAQDRCGASLTAFELVSDAALGLVEKHMELTSPFSDRHPYAVLLEIAGHEDAAQARAMLEELMEQSLERNLIADAVVAQNEAQSRRLWDLRENISEAQAAEGTNVKHDISVPISRIADFIETTGARLQRDFPGARIVDFGHLGDGNLHYNVSAADGQSRDDLLASEPAINRVVYDSVVAHGGSISAEHGIGQLKREELRRSKPDADLRVMRAIKAALDPNNLMNPGKIL